MCQADVVRLYNQVGTLVVEYLIDRTIYSNRSYINDGI